MAKREWYEDPQAQAWLRRVRKDMLPKMKDSSVVMSIYHDDPDPKLAVETGYAVLLDKPLIGVVSPGAKVSRKFVAVCDELVEADLGTDAGRLSAHRRLTETLRRLGLDDS